MRTLAPTPIELWPVFVVAISYDKARRDAEGRRVAQLLSHPGGAWLAGHGDMYEPTGTKLDDEEGKDGPEP